MKKKFLAFATLFTLTAGGFATTNAFAAEHTIKKGETLDDISSQYSMTVDQLKVLNDLTSDAIFAGEKLEVLEKEDFYTIQPGDTLHEIGISKDATVEQLMKWNNIDDADLIFAGEKLAVTKAAGELVVKTTPVVKPVAQAQASAKANSNQQVSKQQTEKKAQQKVQASTEQAKSNAAPQAAAKTFTMTATAYTAYCEGCSGITANGTNLRANPGLKVIAVDPRVIPLGTKVWVEGYGEAIAADTGGAIKGNKIDIFVPNKADAYKWGRKTVQVKILN